jgi:hypothetical protein
MMQNPIAEQLEQTRMEAAEVRAEIDRLTRHYDIVRARLEAYEFAAKAFDNAAPKAALKSAKPTIRTRSRLPSSEWQSIFQLLYTRNGTESFGYDDICDAAESLNVDVKRPSLRTKMMNYANDGHVERVNDGKFGLTRKGIGHFKIEAQALNANEPPADKSAGGSETAPSALL